MGIITINKNRITALLERLPNYRAKINTSNTYKFMNGAAIEFDEVIVQDESLIDSIFIDTATGQYLNDIGNFFRLIRETAETDNEFRARIKGHFTAFFSSGTQVELMNSAATYLSIDTSEMSVYEISPLKAAINLVITTSQVDLMASLINSLTQAKAAGVKLFVSYDTRIPADLGIFTAGVSTLGGRWVA